MSITGLSNLAFPECHKAFYKTDESNSANLWLIRGSVHGNRCQDNLVHLFLALHLTEVENLTVVCPSIPGDHHCSITAVMQKPYSLCTWKGWTPTKTYSGLESFRLNPTAECFSLWAREQQKHYYVLLDKKCFFRLKWHNVWAGPFKDRIFSRI